MCSSGTVHPAGISDFAWSEKVSRIFSPPEKHRVLLSMPDHFKWAVLERRAYDQIEEIMAKRGEIPNQDPAEGKRLRKVFVRFLEEGFIGAESPLAKERARNIKVKPLRELKAQPEVMLLACGKCNLECGFCSVPGDDDPDNQEMPLEIVEKTAVFVRRSFPSPPNVTVSGGEPLLHGRIFEILSILRDCAGSLAMNTNGTLIENEAQADRLADVLDKIVVSLDAPDAKTHDSHRGKGSFDKTVRAVRWLTKSGKCTVDLRMIRFTPDQDIRPMQRYADSLGVTLRVNGFLPLGRGRSFRGGKPAAPPAPVPETPKGVRPSSILYGYHGCPGARTIVAISPNGDIYPCASASSRSIYGREYLIGRIQDGVPLADLFAKSEVAQAFRRKIDDVPSCQECFARHFRVARCRLVPHFGNPEVCESIREAVGRYIWD